jgi:hypothetical protein
MSEREFPTGTAVDRRFGRVGSPQNSGDHDAGVAEIAEKIWPIAHQSSVARKVWKQRYCREAMRQGLVGEQFGVGTDEGRRQDQ